MIVPAKKLQDFLKLENVLVANSTTVAIGDTVIINTAAPQSIIGGKNTTGILLGTVVAIKNGPSQGNVYLQESTVTTLSNNLTVGLISVDVLPLPSVSTYVADLDAVSGTTPNSQYMGYFNLSATLNGTLSEASYSASNEKQFLSYGVNPGNSSQVIGTFTKIANA